MANNPGFDLENTFGEELHLVPEKYKDKPHQDIKDFYSRLNWEELKKNLWKPLSQDNILRSFTGRDWISLYSFEEFMRYYFGSVIMLDASKEIIDRREVSDREADRYDYVPLRDLGPLENYEIIKRLGLAMRFDRDWNALVEAYNNLREFDFGVKDFSVKIDFTTSYGERGYTQSTIDFPHEDRIFIDGRFAFFVYYKDKFVMTVGFNITSKKQVLINQVQLRRKKGNRFIYKIPYKMDRLDWILCRFYYAFPDWDICLVDGESLADSYVKEYKRERDSFFRRQKMQPEYYKNKTPPPEFLEDTYNRIVDFYNKDSKCFNRVETTWYDKLTYWCLEPKKEYQ